MTDTDPGGPKTCGSGATTLKLITTISYSCGAVQWYQPTICSILFPDPDFQFDPDPDMIFGTKISYI
jgi:hypothetical protein